MIDLIKDPWFNDEINIGIPNNARILFIEDEPEMRKLVVEHFKDIGFEVSEAEDGLIGQTLAQECSPDLILMDIMLPKMDGLTLSKKFKENPRTANIPILMITALSNIKDKVRGLNINVDDFITKPFELEKLESHIKDLLKKKNEAV